MGKVQRERERERERIVSLLLSSDKAIVTFDAVMHQQSIPSILLYLPLNYVSFSCITLLQLMRMKESVNYKIHQKCNCYLHQLHTAHDMFTQSTFIRIFLSSLPFHYHLIESDAKGRLNWQNSFTYKAGYNSRCDSDNTLNRYNMIYYNMIYYSMIYCSHTYVI